MLKLFALLLFFSVTAMAQQVDGITDGFELQAQAEKVTQIVSTAQLKTMLDEELDMILVDIRTTEEIHNMDGRIDAPQNVHIPRGWLEFRIQRVALKKDIPIVVYCGGGLRSPLAAKTLQDMGYTHVKNYADGFFGWKKAGLPVKP